MKLTTILLLFPIVCVFSCSSTSSSETTADSNTKKGDPIFVSEIAVQAYSFRNFFPKDIPGTLDRIQAMGIREIEGSAGSIAPESYRMLCEKRGISIPSTGASFKLLEEDPDSVARNATILGSTFVMCAWVPHEDDFDKAEADHAIEVFNRAGKVLKENGITFCYHPHGYEFHPHEEGTLLDYLIENTNPEYVSFEMDVFWVQFGGGDPVALLKKYGDRWKLMHLKDMKHGIPKDLTGGTNKEYNVPLGTGQIDMRNILIEGRKIGIAHYFIEDESKAVIDQVPKSIAYLKGLRY